MIKAELEDDGFIHLTSDYDMRDRDRIKQIAGTRYRNDGWVAPLTWASCLQLRGIFGNQLELGQKLIQWATWYAEAKVKPGLATRQTIQLSEQDSILESWENQRKFNLYPFQEAGVKFLATAKTAYLADEMGTGKTAQVISTMKYLKESKSAVFPALVVAPKSLLKNWEREMALWMPEAKVSVVVGNVTQRRAAIAAAADVYLVSYDGARMHSRLSGYGSVRLRTCVVCDKTKTGATAEKDYPQTRCERCPKELNQVQWTTIVTDESHRMKEPKSKQTRALWALRTEHTKQVYCLSGTALTSAPHDLWSALRLLFPESFSNRSKYIERYCLTQFNAFGGMTVAGLRPDTKDELFAIIDPFMRRMTKKAVLPFLPDKVYTRRDLEMVPAQKKQYNQLQKGMVAELTAGGYIMAENVLTLFTRLDQMASACLAENESDEGYHMVAPSNKIEAMLEVLEDMDQEPLVVFSASRQLIELGKEALKKEKISYTEVVGGQTADQRDKAVSTFQGGHARVIFCSTGAGSEGLTLTRASTALFLQRPWKMTESKQAEDRIHRIGAEKHESVTIIDLVSTGTTEERRLKVLKERGDNLEEVMRDAALLKYLIEGEK